MALWFRQFHRWIALAFALPLIVVIFTGLVLSVEPWVVTQHIQPGSLTADKVQALLRQHDPEGKARSLSFRSYDQALTISAGRGENVIVHTASGSVQPAPSSLAATFTSMRRLHEHLLFDAGWLVIASTGAMLALALLGVLMGWPKFANSLAGWHKAVAWIGLPLLVLSPLTGMFLATSLSFSGPPPAEAKAGKPPKLMEAVRIVGERHDLSSLVWLRARRGMLLARLVEDGEYKVYAVTTKGTVAMPRNWPRLWHEGNFAGAWSAGMNLLISLAMVFLLGSGLWIWFSRQRRLRSRRIA